MDHLFTVMANRIAGWAGQPFAFIVAAFSVILWALSGPVFGYSDTWQLVINTSTTIVTFLMVFLIQNAQNRDAVALQAKLDELIRATRAARNQFIGIEHLTEKEVDMLRVELEEQYGEEEGEMPPGHAALKRLLARR